MTRCSGVCNQKKEVKLTKSIHSEAPKMDYGTAISSLSLIKEENQRKSGPNTFSWKILNNFGLLL
jgi:hypothetical protein